MSETTDRLRALVRVREDERDAQFYRDQAECECNACSWWAKGEFTGGDDHILQLTTYNEVVEKLRLYRTRRDGAALLKRWLDEGPMPKPPGRFDA